MDDGSIRLRYILGDVELAKCRQVDLYHTRCGTLVYFRDAPAGLYRVFAVRTTMPLGGGASPWRTLVGLDGTRNHFMRNNSFGVSARSERLVI